MDMEKLIRVGKVDVSQRSCTVSFNVNIGMEGNSFQHQAAEMTHNTLYKLLETATNVKAVDDGKTSKFVTFKQGVVEFEVYTKEAWRKA